MGEQLLFKAAIALFLINIAAFFYGIYYYDSLLVKTNPLLWIFALDSPIHALLFAAVIGLALAGKTNDWIVHLAAIGSIKYGIWTMFVILFQAEYFLAPSVAGQYVFLFIAHIGQLLQGLFLIGTRRMAIAMLLILGGWTLINDYADYALGTHPMIGERGLETVAMATVLISIVSVAAVFYGSQKRIDLLKQVPVIGELREYLFG
jgi:uncharacterized membrane protein YpjA